ncbi:MAG TPA: hypothetical protein VFQ68_45440 [Streptosporangiaceae bacterium]|nr:hypothetical protein [Streptosporangiaceae bacterium]
MVTRARLWRRRARAAAAWLRSAAAALVRTSWVAASQVQASEMTSRGRPDRRTGPEVRFPAPVIVALSSPNVVSRTGRSARSGGIRRAASRDQVRHGGGG